jgi:hypothetical protein
MIQKKLYVGLHMESQFTLVILYEIIFISYYHMRIYLTFITFSDHNPQVPKSTLTVSLNFRLG